MLIHADKGPFFSRKESGGWQQTTSTCRLIWTDTNCHTRILEI